MKGPERTDGCNLEDIFYLGASLMANKIVIPKKDLATWKTLNKLCSGCM